MRIGIDIDDTIAMTYEGLIPKLMKHFHVKKVDYGKGELYSDILGITSEQFSEYTKIYCEDDILKLEVKAYCKEVLDRLKKLNHEIILITARDEKTFHKPKNVTQMWLEENQIPYDKLIVSAKNKSKVCKKENIDIFIDDNIANCIAVKQLGIIVYLMDSKTNQRKVNLNRVIHWLELEKLVKEVDHGR